MSSARTAGVSASYLHTTHIIHNLYLGLIFSQDCRCIRKLPEHNSHHSYSLPWLHLYIFSQDCRCIHKLPKYNSHHLQSLPQLHLQPARTAGVSTSYLNTTHIIHNLYLGYDFSQDCRCIRKLPAHNSHHSQSLPWLHLQPGLQVYLQAT